MGTQTPSTVTETSGPESSEAADRMATIESNMAQMHTQFNTWMIEMREHMTPAQSPDQTTESYPTHKNPKNDRPLDSTPTSHQSKRPNTRTTPRRLDPMIIENQLDLHDTPGIKLFPGNEPSTQLPGISTQPELPATPPRDPGGKMSPHIQTPVLSPFRNMSQLLARHNSPSYPLGYDTDHPIYVYRDNGTGGLYCVGLAQTGDFNSDGAIKGPQPTEDQSAEI
jgi:hypothetical protein